MAWHYLIFPSIKHRNNVIMFLLQYSDALHKLTNQNQDVIIHLLAISVRDFMNCINIILTN